ncbi:tRNA pseudouridine(31) synthase [Cucumispora dikerogammari]|nr:tRNA pseudouridine(31) synthase [Cucumispora dikerogammari]
MHEYIFEHKASAKGRWFGKQLIDVLTIEFTYRSEIYFKEAISLGIITVNRRQVYPTYIIKSEDVIYHVIHKHEPNDVSVVISENFSENIKEIECLEKFQKDILYKNISRLSKIAENHKKHPIKTENMDGFSKISENINGISLKGEIRNIQKKIEIISITPDFLVINKPYGLASHPTGGYNKYSVTEILYATIFQGLRDENHIKFIKDLRLGLVEENRKNYSKEVFDKVTRLKEELNSTFKLGCVNRLDVPTSGIMILGFNDANLYHQNIANIRIKKTYLAMVKKINFFEKVDNKSIKESWSSFLNTAVLFDYHKSISYDTYKNYFVCFENIKSSSIDMKMEICKDEGKLAITLFRLWDSNDKYSIIECIPITGRTHQIRLHLAPMGCPIVKDSLYGTPNERQGQKNGKTCSYSSKLANEAFIFKNCEGENGTACRNKDYYICLHAFKYTINGVEYDASLPDWVNFNV